ncbi:hypothetical protein GDO86_008269 [Hymenochirus boettgeri]|uniref:Uncharacterized protein n=1 Tax=Hymenochirus boettgeri TaxID=247094 RepID=A0A8T2J515_9PIPI|nr:hypothetical protein GDO86_008269 [Hymenochirus boettgeri]
MVRGKLTVILGFFICPLCQLDCESQEQLISHVYRQLSSPGSLGRHLLIHSEDQLSNCAVCGAKFSSHAILTVLSPDTWNEKNNHKDSTSTEETSPEPSAIYPAGILLVCNNCSAYRKLMTDQTPTVRTGSRRMRDREAKRQQRMQETDEQRARRLQRDREAMVQSVQMKHRETPS